MYIYGDEREHVVKLGYVSVENGLGNQFTVVNHFRNLLGSTSTILATYSSKKRAKKEVRRIVKALEKDEKVYKMRLG